ncbi:MAG: DNA polymerase III subunit delta [Bacteroidales bacterium]|nr:DNA polymerase III subunit delta [Bacteroidales bacterium]
MQFSEIIGQDALKQKLIQSVTESRVSHAQMFLGPAGSGKLALALAYATYINCTGRRADDSCGICPSCVKMARLTHPDLHFVFPTTTTKKVKKDPESNLFLDEWRQFVLQEKAYTGLNAWYGFLGVENKQGTIFTRDATELIRKLSFKAYEAEYKIALIWMAEKINAQAANKMLKLLEEPPDKTLFLLIAEEQDQILPTVRSRTYLVKVPRTSDSDILDALISKYQCREAEAREAALMANGNWPEAIRIYENNEDEKYNFQTFQQWMRLCFKSNVIELTDFALNIAGIGREKQKALLHYGLGVFRNGLLVNSRLHELLRLTDDEKEFNIKFAPFVHPAVIVQMIRLMDEGIEHIERNAHAGILFTDISLKMIKLLKNKS